MKFTKDWLSDHLSTSKSEKQIIEKLNGIGLEVEKVDHVKNDLSEFGVEPDAPDLFNNQSDNLDPNELSSFESDNDQEDDLEIPAFLRRQKN